VKKQLVLIVSAMIIAPLLWRPFSVRAVGQSVAFEVASVKRAASSPGPVRSILLFSPDGGFRTTNASLKALVQTAYGVQDFQISGASGWMDSDKYDVQAKPAIDIKPSRADTLLMLQNLLVDRFKLKIRRETREDPVYALMVAKDGPRMHIATDPSGGARGGANGRLTGKRTMAQLAEMLSGLLRRPVVDQTSMAGVYDFTLEWLPEVGQTGPDALSPAPADPNAPSIFTALQEQLGLRLESSKAQVEILIIDHAEPASEN